MVVVKRKRQKIAAVILLMTTLVTGIPITNAKAEDNQTPTLRVYQDGLTPKIEWAVDMADSDVLYQTGYEDGQSLPNLVYNSGNGAGKGTQSITGTDKYTGSKSYKADDTRGKGNAFNPPVTQSDTNQSLYDNMKVDGGDDISISFMVKTTGRAELSFFGNWAYADSFTNYGAKVIKPAKKGDIKIQVDNTTGVNVNSTLSFDVDTKYNGGISVVKAVNRDENTVTLDKVLSIDLPVGYTLKTRPIRYGWTFPVRNISNGDGWELVNINTKVNKYADVDWVERGGISLRKSIYSDGETYIDNLKFGYATKAELYRGATKVYEGLLSDFTDTAATDKATPNPVNDVTMGLQNGKLIATVHKPKDKGTEYSYKVKSLPRSGVQVDSNVEKVTVESGIRGYSYVIDTNPTTSPSGVVNTTTGNIEVPVTTNDTYYVHIQAVDNVGNKSEITHFSFQDDKNPDIDIEVDLVEDTNGSVTINVVADDKETGVKRILLPNKLWVLGNKASYTVQQSGVYVFKVEDNASNLTEKRVTVSNIKKPGDGSTNGTGSISDKMMLNIEGGDLALGIGDIVSYGKLKLERQPVEYKTTFTAPFSISDLRGTQEGYRLDMSASKIQSVEPVGGYAPGTGNNKLSAGTLKLDPVRTITREGGSGVRPTSALTASTVIDDGAVTVAYAGRGEGAGNFNLEFDVGAISMVLDASRVKVDRINYPEGDVPYESTLTWNLISAP